ncbi:hypothetical protein BaRGS_00008230, partial [Batillaria attramentaria]
EGDFKIAWDCFENSPLSNIEDDICVSESDVPPGNNDEPLFPGAAVSAAVLLNLLHHDQIQTDRSSCWQHFDILCLTLPDGTKMLSSLYKIREHTNMFAIFCQMYTFCSFCTQEEQKHSRQCQNGACMKDLPENGSVFSFIELSPISQLQTMRKKSTVR